MTSDCDSNSGLLGSPVSIDRQITFGEYGHILTNINVFSPDGKWIVYDVRSTASGDVFDGDRIERVNIETGLVEVLFNASNGAKVGVATYSPREEKVIFIHGPEHPTPEWSYAPNHRQGLLVDVENLQPRNFDARDLVPPGTPGALRGGSHVHVFSPDGKWISFTYDDARIDPSWSARNVGVGVLGNPVSVPRSHARNHDGDAFSVLVTRTVENPKPGSDEISRAAEEGWIGADGYCRLDGSRQRRAIAFQGDVRTSDGRTIREIFVVDLPENLTRPSIIPLQGTLDQLPAPPAGVSQRRLTFTGTMERPGIAGPRHWLRSSPDGRHIAFLMADAADRIQLYVVSPNGGPVRQISHDPWNVASAFSWNSSGTRIAYVADNSIMVLDVDTGASHRLNAPDRQSPISPLACVFHGDDEIAYLRLVTTSSGTFNQVFIVTINHIDQAYK